MNMLIQYSWGYIHPVILSLTIICSAMPSMPACSYRVNLSQVASGGILLTNTSNQPININMFTQNMYKRCMNFWEVFTINSRENIGDIDGHVNLAMLFQNYLTFKIKSLCWKKCHGININIEQNAKYRGNIYVMNVVVIAMVIAIFQLSLLTC